MDKWPKLDNHDSRIRYFPLLLERELDAFPHIELPEGFCFAFYQDGDRDAWIKIEKSAKEFSSLEEGLRAWDRYYGGHEPELAGRMLFVVNDRNEKVATATAYYDVTGGDGLETGWLHWVAVQREYQGKGLSKPLISRALAVLKELGYTHVKISTQTTTWLACKIYLDFGFLPEAQNAVDSLDGWRILKRLTGHPALSRFDAAKEDEVFRGQDR